MPSTGSLPMYDLPALRSATDAWWSGLMRHMRRLGIKNIPIRRTNPVIDRIAHWQSPSLLLSQTCGHPFATNLSDRVRVVAAPCYDVADIDGPFYRGTLIVSAESDINAVADLEGATAVVNGTDSYSGFSALWRILEPFLNNGPFLNDYWVSGAHPLSIEAVATGHADCATIDAVTLALVSKVQPDLARHIKVLAPGSMAPALPYITSGETSDETLTLLRAALTDAVADPTLHPARQRLRIKGFEVRNNEDYRPFAEWANAPIDKPFARHEVAPPEAE